ncbi:hypothetical protein GCK72_012553 [Caenorhabditis remanei]|uniref:RNA helicase n=1 Tax=Caenorhabditis remanei TaxID=31234 RepID=A0A6A5GLC1_CAERE|nr:hypothetical protein GCK72_012553 [Caenorhabditis remanei]KAF1756100.1 hypothetical protein GCK72_012553 [Caenorhabditis remanei]
MEFTEVIEVLDRGSSIDVQSKHTFESLMIGQKTLERLKAAQFDRPSPVQAKAIPVGLLGRDMLVQAKSGTGKTLVFSVLAVENLDLRASYVQKIVITPTREISTQIKETMRKVAPPGARTSVYVGGCGHKLNMIDLKKTRPQIVIGTPGRIAQLLKLGAMDLSHVDFFVLDEADKLMDDVFRDDINIIINSLPPIRQVAVFSATYPRNLDNLLSTFLRDAALVRFNADDVQLIGIKQYVVTKCSPMLEKLTHVLKSIRYVQALVFCDQIAKCEPIASHLKSEGLDVTFVSSAMSQKDRQLAVDQLRAKRVKILVSSDLTARGIDADNVNLVVNVDAAANEETYFHRIGRAARFGAHGAAVTLLEDEKALKCFTALAYRGKVTVKRVARVENLPSDLAKNVDFWMDLPFFIDFEEKSKVIKGPNDLEKVPERKEAVEALQRERGDSGASQYKYDRNGMLAMRLESQPTSSESQTSQVEKNSVKEQDSPEEITKKVEEMSIEEKKQDEEPVVAPKKTFKERLAELKQAKKDEKKEMNETPKVVEKTKFKFVPTREKAKKKYYMRGELQHIRDAFTDEQWRAYAESKFDFSQEPFLDAFGFRARRGSSPRIENGTGDSAGPSTSTSSGKVKKTGRKSPENSSKSSEKSESKALNIIKYSRYDMKKIQKEVPKNQWLPYVKSKWDTSDEPWELDPSMRCPFEERLRRIRQKEKNERKKVIEERKRQRDEDRSELVSFGTMTPRHEIKDTSWEGYKARLRKDFAEKTAKRKQDELEGKPRSLTRIGPVVPARDPPHIYRYRLDMYTRRLAEQDAWLMQETRLQDGKIADAGIQTAIRELAELSCQTDPIKFEQDSEDVENKEDVDDEEYEYYDEEEEDEGEEYYEEEIEKDEFDPFGIPSYEQELRRHFGDSPQQVPYCEVAQEYLDYMNSFPRPPPRVDPNDPRYFLK